MNIEEAMKELRESYELKHRQWAYNCLDVIKEELEKKDKVINEMAEKLVEAHGWFYSEFDNYSKEDWKEYFYKKVQK